jgi:hypothetical protein
MIAALFVATLPYAAHAQGTVRGAEEGAAAGDGAAVERSAPQPVRSAAFWALRSGPGFANTSFVSTVPRSGTAAMCVLASCCQSEV